jgi:hypothetical protein
LKGGVGYGFLFRSEIFIPTTQELEYYPPPRAKHNFFYQNLTLGYDENSKTDYFFFPPPKPEYFFQQHWESEYFFLEKNNTPPPFLS